MVRRLTFMLASVFLMSAFVASAQEPRCSLSVSVADVNGQGVKDVDVTLRIASEKKELKPDRKSDSHLFVDLKSGKYQITATKDGFKKSFKLLPIDCSKGGLSESVTLYEGDSKGKVILFDQGFENNNLIDFPKLSWNGFATHVARPEYPNAARAVRASGEVVVQVGVDEQGKVVFAAAMSGHPLLRHAAEQAAQNSEIAISYFRGKAVKVRGLLVFRFVN